MLAPTGPINWEVARQIGIATASGGADDTAPSEEDSRGLADTVRAAELAVADFTGLAPPGDVPRVEAVRRAQGVEVNTPPLRDPLDPGAAKMTAALSQSQRLAGGGGPG